MKYLMGIDCGGTLVKAGIYDVEGNEAALSQRPFENLTPAPGWNERDGNAFREAVFDVIADAVKKSGVNTADILSISFSGQGNGLYLTDDEGNFTRNPILSSDNRARDIIKKWISSGLIARVFRPHTFQDIWAAQVISLLAWVSQNEPETMAKTKHVLSAKDYIRHMLAGVFCGELTESSGWSCMDVKTGEYVPEIFESVGLMEYMPLMPKAIQSTDIAGAVTKEAAARTGLCAGTPVSGGMFDITACPLGTGILDNTKLSIVIGSWGMNQYIDKQPARDLFMTSRYILPGYYLLSEGSATSAANLEWFIDRFMRQEKAEAKAAGKNIYQTVNEMVSGIDTHDCPIIFLPFLFTSNANIDAKSVFVGLLAAHTKAHMLRAVYEGIAFCHKYHLERLYKNRARENFDAVRISGGGTRSSVWVQMFADIIGLPMEVPAAEELGVVGAAMCAGMAVGQYKNANEAAEKFVKVKAAVHPDSELVPYYEQKYQLYKKVLASLDGAWAGFDALNQ